VFITVSNLVKYRRALGCGTQNKTGRAEELFPFFYGRVFEGKSIAEFHRVHTEFLRETYENGIC
jgi:hypothetical protein